MKKTTNFVKQAFLMLGIVSFIGLYSCNEDEETVEAPVASFQSAVNADNYLEVTFTNYSKNATAYSWNFGDDLTSVEANPAHVYAAVGEYDVVLTATNSAGSATYSATILITDPLEALRILTGQDGKTWKLVREGRAGGVGPNAAGAGSYFALENNGKRPCVFYHEFTFHPDGKFVFNDKGNFWGEAAIFDGTALKEICFPAIAANMVNKNGVDVKAFLSGTHQFVYNTSAATITLTGLGAWMGMPQLGTVGESIVPEAAKTFGVTIEEKVGYDQMVISYKYEELYWDFIYASYTTGTEPIVVESAPVFGTDLPDITPTVLSRTFASAAAADFVLLDTIKSASTVEYGVTDPAGGAIKVGKFNRTAEQYQELQFQTSPVKNDINFAKLTKVKFDVYIPSTNVYTGTLTKAVIFGVADKSQTEQWWTKNREWINDGSAIAADTWVTLTYQLNAPTAGGGTYIPTEVTYLDMFYIQIGGGGHSAPGTFYIRNLVID